MKKKWEELKWYQKLFHFHNWVSDGSYGLGGTIDKCTKCGKKRADYDPYC